MPKTMKQRRSEIVNSLVRKYGDGLIPYAEFETTLRAHDVTNPRARKEYTKELLDGQYMTRVEGGLLLSDDSLREGIIIVRVSPSQHKVAVFRAIDAVVAQFRPLVTLEIEAEDGGEHET